MTEPSWVLKRQQPKPGIRVARFCTACATRVFGDPAWKCPDHPGKTVDQENWPYFGRPTS